MSRCWTAKEIPSAPSRSATSGRSIRSAWGWARTASTLIAGYDDLFIATNYVAALSHGFLAELTIGAAPSFAPTEDFWKRSAYFDSPPPPPSTQDFTTGVAIASTGDGAMFVASTVNGRVDIRGMFLTKLDASGQTIRSTRLSGDAGDYLSAVALSPNGDLFVAGAASVEVAGVEVGQQDAFVAKVDKETGAVQWATVPGTPESDFPTAMTFDPSGNVYLTGQTLGTIGGGTTNQGGVDIFAVKIGPSGGILSSWAAWQRRRRPSRRGLPSTPAGASSSAASPPARWSPGSRAQADATCSS